MKRITIGTIVGAIIFFVYQSVMWMGGFHGEIAKHTPDQDNIMNYLGDKLSDGVYMMPMTDPADPDRARKDEERMKENVGKPWAMILYHEHMMDFSVSYMLVGLFYSLMACLIASLVLYYGQFPVFGVRFFVSMAFALFTLSQGVLDNMNWWSYPWQFVRPEVVDLTLGWGITSLWLASYVKRMPATAG